MLRSPWFHLSLLLIGAGIALTLALGVFGWLALAVAIGIAVLDGILLYSAYAIGQGGDPGLDQLPISPPEERISVIFDGDVAIGRPFRDVGSGLALLYLLGRPEINVRAVTTTYGDGPVSMTTRTTRRLLRDVGKERVSVIQGTRSAMGEAHDNAAARYLVKAVNMDPGQIAILTTGALTNLKHAVLLDPQFFDKVRQLYLVGGVIGEVTWSGRRLLERNFSLDPEAAYRVLQAQCPTTVIPGGAGLTAVFRREQMASLGALEDPVSKTILERVRLWFGLMRLWFRDDGFAMWDEIAAVAILHPHLMRIQRAHLPVTIDDLREGRLVLDLNREGPVRVVRGVEAYDRFIRTLLSAWHALGLRCAGR